VDNIKTYAAMLVASSYAMIGINGYMESCYYGKGERHPEEITIDPFADTYEGMRQACVCIEWLRVNENKLWVASKSVPNVDNPTWWEHALQRLKYCGENISGSN